MFNLDAEILSARVATEVQKALNLYFARYGNSPDMWTDPYFLGVVVSQVSVLIEKNNDSVLDGAQKNDVAAKVLHMLSGLGGLRLLSEASLLGQQGNKDFLEGMEKGGIFVGYVNDLYGVNLPPLVRQAADRARHLYGDATPESTGEELRKLVLDEPLARRLGDLG